MYSHTVFEIPQSWLPSHTQGSFELKTYPNLSEPTWTYLNLSEPIQTFPNLFEPIQSNLNLFEPIQSNPTYPKLSEPIPTYMNLSEPIQTYLNLSKPICTYPNLSKFIQTYTNHIQTDPVRTFNSIIECALSWRLGWWILALYCMQCSPLDSFCGAVRKSVNFSSF